MIRTAYCLLRIFKTLFFRVVTGVQSLLCLTVWQSNLCTPDILITVFPRETDSASAFGGNENENLVALASLCQGGPDI
jgi:hypothetical protein